MELVLRIWRSVPQGNCWELAHTLRPAAPSRAGRWTAPAAPPNLLLLALPPGARGVHERDAMMGLRS
jgi:hypothetical protein